MPETPYIETNALLAVMNGNDDEALKLVDELLPGERANLVKHLSRLSALADDRYRCRGCGQTTANNRASTVIYSGYLGGPRAAWHRECHAAQAAPASDGGGRG